MKNYILLLCIALITTPFVYAQNACLPTKITEYGFNVNGIDSAINHAVTLEYNMQEQLIKTTGNGDEFFEYDQLGNLTYYRVNKCCLGNHTNQEQTDNYYSGYSLDSTIFYKTVTVEVQDELDYSWKEIYTYNPSGTLKEKIRYLYNDAWYPNTKTNYEYSATNKVLLEQTQRLVNGVYEDEILIEYQYNNVDSLIEKDFTYIAQRILKHTYEYIGSTYKKESIFKLENSGNYIRTNEKEWMRNLDGTLHYTIHKSWNDDGTSQGLRTGYFYDPQTDCLSWTNYTWGAGNMNTFVFDTDYGISHHYEYDLLLSSENPIDASSLEIFPNPTTGLINLKMDEKPIVLLIHSIDGRFVQRIENPEKYLSVNSLESGSYVMKVIYKNKSETRIFNKI